MQPKFELTCLKCRRSITLIQDNENPDNNIIGKSILRVVIDWPNGKTETRYKCWCGQQWNIPNE